MIPAVQGATIHPWHSISRIQVKGFKSIRDDIDLEIRPLTVLAGQNSAGKSSAMQPLLLLKQTLEAPNDPGALLLHGPCFKGRRAGDLLWQGQRPHEGEGRWSVGLETDNIWLPGGPTLVSHTFAAGEGHRGVRLEEITLSGQRWGGTRVVREDLGADQVAALASQLIDEPGMRSLASLGVPTALRIHRKRCDMELVAARLTAPQERIVALASFVDSLAVTRVIHLPGLRGNPERSYPATGSPDSFSGPFHPYTANVLLQWSDALDARISGVSDDLELLGLSTAVRPTLVDDTRIELSVGRMPSRRGGGVGDMVNVADVGLGTSQILPVLVALHAADPGVLVHVEQPEIHLHPAAQVRLADILLGAAQRGVRVVVETHSALLLKAIQWRVTEWYDPALVTLHWFTRDAEGATSVHSGGLDTNGAFGSWPVDFTDVELDIEEKFIRAPLRGIGPV